jgi:hypothetical protein
VVDATGQQVAGLLRLFEAPWRPAGEGVVKADDGSRESETADEAVLRPPADTVYLTLRFRTDDRRPSRFGAPRSLPPADFSRGHEKGEIDHWVHKPRQ